MLTIRPRSVSETHRFPIPTLLIATGVTLLTWLGGLNAQQSRGEAISIGTDDIGGVVTGTNGPEVGVWVIAETADLPTKFVKIVVTDDRGQSISVSSELIPNLIIELRHWPSGAFSKEWFD